MDFKSQVINAKYKDAAEGIAACVAKDPERLDELMEFFFDDDLRTCQRAAWPVCKLGIKNPELLQKYTRRMIENLNNPKHDAVVRNTVRIWAEMNIEEQYEGEIFERCFNYLCNPKVAVAIRAFSITVAAKIAKKYPELSEELRLELENQMNFESKPAILVRLRKGLKTLRR